MTSVHPTLESTLVLIKPDAVRRGLMGTILSRLESKGLLVLGLRSFVFSDELIREHYAELTGRSFFEDLAAFMTSGMTVAVWVNGVDAVDVVRTMIGATNSRTAIPGTIRGDFAVSTQRNLIHASDSRETARIELARFFPEGPTVAGDESAIRDVYAEAETC